MQAACGPYLLLLLGRQAVQCRCPVCILAHADGVSCHTVFLQSVLQNKLHKDDSYAAGDGAGLRQNLVAGRCAVR